MGTILSLLAYRNNVQYVKNDSKNNIILGFHTVVIKSYKIISKFSFSGHFGAIVSIPKVTWWKTQYELLIKYFDKKSDNNQLFFQTRQYIHSIYSSQKMRQRCFLPEMGLARASGQIVVACTKKRQCIGPKEITYLV